MRIALALLAAVAAVVSPPHPAGAQAPSESALAKARDHFGRGQEAYQADRYSEAFAEYEAGYKLVPRPGFLLNMAQAQRKLGNLREARDLYRKFLLADPSSPQRDSVVEVMAEIDTALVEKEAPAPGDPKAPGVSAVPPPRRATPAPAPALTADPTSPPDRAPPALAPETSSAVSASPRPAGDDATPALVRRWWFWAAIGAVAAGLATGVVLIAGSTSPSDDAFRASGSWGSLRR